MGLTLTMHLLKSDLLFPSCLRSWFCRPREPGKKRQIRSPTVGEMDFIHWVTLLRSNQCFPAQSPLEIWWPIANPSMASPPTSIPDTQLPLSPAELQLLRYHQHLALANNHSRSSRAASQASSQGRLLLDPSSLGALSAHFDRLILSIQQRWAEVR